MNMPAPGAQERAASSSDCSECSHCAKKSQLPKKAGVRVSVNLRQFFSDQRARAFMWAPYGRCVQWLGRRVARVFGLPDDIALMSRGHMLPVIEPLLMLDRDDPVDVVNMSYVFTAHDKQEEPGVTSQKDASGTRAAPAGETSGAGAAAKLESASQTPTSSQPEPEPRAPSPSVAGLRLGPASESAARADDGEELLRLKRRALRLLDEHCALSEAAAPKRLRRRRRRRRAALPGAGAADATGAADAADTAPSDDEAAGRAPERGEPPGEPPGEALVLRNGAGERPPRLVRPLSPLAQCVN